MTAEINDNNPEVGEKEKKQCWKKLTEAVL